MPGSDPGLALWAARGGDFQLCAFARAAMHHAARVLATPERDVFLLPRFLCEEAIEPFTRAGVRVRFYPVAEDLGPQPGALAALADRNTRGVLLVNYFGFAAPRFDETAAFCRERGLVLLEDNTQGFLGATAGRALGTLGDVGFFSFRKTLPLPDGAGMLVNDPALRDVLAGLVTRSTAVPVRALARAAFNLWRERTDWPVPRTAPLRRHGHYQPLPFEAAGGAMSGLSRRLLGAMDPARIRHHRRTDYQRVASRLRDRHGLTPLMPELPEGTCPYAVPCRAPDARAAMAALRADRLRADRWPDWPAGTDLSGFPFERVLDRELLLVHLGY